jgi:GT2 family glycosyltransferase
VARGRNYAIELSSAPILIMLDDDAEMGNKECLHNLLEVFEVDDNNRKTAVVSFKVVYFETGQMQVNAFPHKQFDKYKDKHSFLTYYYAGGAHAIRREVFEKLGKYPEDFFYGMEEYDLGYRIIDAGYAIKYSDRILMLHKESPLGRKTKKEKQAMLWINKSKVAWRYLPFIYFLSTAFMWSLEYLRKTGFDIPGWVRGWVEVFSIPGRENRKPVRDTTMNYLKETGARLWY